MNRGSKAMAMDYLNTSNLQELDEADSVSALRRKRLEEEASRPPVTEGGPVTYRDFGFAGAARAFYRVDFPDAHETDVAAPPDSIVGFPVDNFQKNVKSAKPALPGLEVVNWGGMG